ncbi:MAG: response regulator [Terracidiphilus sp.]|jgi:CheY-like chemotaxis protein
MTGRRSSPVVPISEVPPADTTPYRPTVLVVDDELAIAETLAAILSQSGYATMTAYDGQEAMEIALLTPPELLITDVSMPGMSGIELAITLRRVFPDCKILLFSGDVATAGLLAVAQRAGHTFTLLSKPVHPEELLARVSESLKPVSSATV